MIMNGIQQTTDVKYKYWSVAELLPYKQLKKLQLDRLKEQINYLWSKSSFYREKWEASGFQPEKLVTLADIKQIPFVTKEEIRQSQEVNPPYGIMQVDNRGPITRIAMTSGTTGDPILIPFTEEDYFGVWCEGAVRSLWAAGIRKEDIVHVAFGFTPFVGLFGAYDACEHLIGSQVIPGGAWSSLLRLKMIKKLRVTVLLGTPTYILHLARVAEENGIDPRSLGIKTIITTGEPGMMSVPSTGARLKAVWGSNVFETSGTQETNYIAWVCEEGTAHLNDDLLYFEVLDPETDEPVEPGQPGKLVVTDLVQKTHPLIRFATGDIVNGIEEDAKVCECGRTLSKFKGFKGRIGDIIKVRGVSVSVAGVENVIRGIEECSDNYEYLALTDESGMDKIKVRVEPKSNVENHLWEAVRQQVAKSLHLAFMINIDVEIVPPGTLPVFELKAKRFRDLR
ncbi:MAG TPA: AMP-binding protein [Negativicutes bacterium]